MARDNPMHRRDGKKARNVSTSGIFKKHKGNPSAEDARKGLTRLPRFLRPKKRNSKPKPEHPLSVEFSYTAEDSRKHIDEKNKSQLDTARDGHIGQARRMMQHARDRIQEVDDSSKSLQGPLDDEVLELTRKNGAVVRMTLGKRMNAYRELVQREESTLHGLFEQYAEVSRQIERLALDWFGPSPPEAVLEKPAAETLDFEDKDQRDLAAVLEAEKERVWNAAVLVGERAIEATRANERESKLEDRRRLQQLCESMFAEDGSSDYPSLVSPVTARDLTWASIEHANADTAALPRHNAGASDEMRELDASKLIFTPNSSPKALPKADEIAKMDA
ncbi:MAG: hypothetical protein Q9216_002471 [Gyalolechia sp. 2 TL-2023]